MKPTLFALLLLLFAPLTYAQDSKPGSAEASAEVRGQRYSVQAYLPISRYNHFEGITLLGGAAGLRLSNLWEIELGGQEGFFFFNPGTCYSAFIRGGVSSGGELEVGPHARVVLMGGTRLVYCANDTGSERQTLLLEATLALELLHQFSWCALSLQLGPQVLLSLHDQLRHNADFHDIQVGPSPFEHEDNWELGYELSMGFWF